MARCVLLQRGGGGEFIDFDEVAAFSETKGSVGCCDCQQNGNGTPIEPCVPVGELGSQDGEGLQHVANKQCLTDGSAEPAVIDGPDIPKNPACG